MTATRPVAHERRDCLRQVLGVASRAGQVDVLTIRERTMQSAMCKGWTRLAAAALVALLSWPAAAQKTDQIKAYEEAFYRAYPDISIKWVRDSTGIITAKVLAEKANPQADLVI